MTHSIHMTETFLYVQDCSTVPVLPRQAEPLRVVQPSPMSARAQGHAGEPVHPGKQSVVSCWRLHAAGIRDNAPSSVHQMR